MSLFISFEGGEGTGKSTQAERLCQRLHDANVRVLFVHEPGDTPLGVRLRQLLKGNPWGEQAISHGAELFLFSAARAELVAKVLKPVLKQYDNIVIVADRYVDSTTAYQGYGRRLPLSQVNAINALATQGLKPDMTFLLDCLPEVALQRLGDLQPRLPLEPQDESEGGRIDQEGTRRFEEESLEFHLRVRNGYLRLAEQEPERWYVIDAEKPAEEITETIWNHVQSRLAQDVIQEEKFQLELDYRLKN